MQAQQVSESSSRRIESRLCCILRRPESLTMIGKDLKGLLFSNVEKH